MRPSFPRKFFWRSFFEGMGSIFDIQGQGFRRKYKSPYGYSNDPWEEDREALRGDWEAILGDWEKVMKDYGIAIEKEKDEE